MDKKMDGVVHGTFDADLELRLGDFVLPTRQSVVGPWHSDRTELGFVQGRMEEGYPQGDPAVYEVSVQKGRNRASVLSCDDWSATPVENMSCSSE